MGKESTEMPIFNLQELQELLFVAYLLAFGHLQEVGVLSQQVCGCTRFVWGQLVKSGKERFGFLLDCCQLLIISIWRGMHLQECNILHGLWLGTSQTKDLSPDRISQKKKISFQICMSRIIRIISYIFIYGVRQFMPVVDAILQFLRGALRKVFHAFQIIRVCRNCIL